MKEPNEFVIIVREKYFIKHHTDWYKISNKSKLFNNYNEIIN